MSEVQEFILMCMAYESVIEAAGGGFSDRVKVSILSREIMKICNRQKDPAGCIKQVLNVFDKSIQGGIQEYLEGGTSKD